MTDPERTIAAQATAAGQGAIAVIRMSGPGCMDILKQCTPAAFTERLRPRRATLVCIRNAEGAAIDQALVTWFPAPASYTGEDTAEISCHGGMLVTDRLLKRLYQCGASPAEPGEFTKRAFLNGRIDLTQAESVIDVINAQNDFALESSLHQLQGTVKEKIKGIRGAVLHEIAFIESALDDPEHISIDGYGEELMKQVDALAFQIKDLLQCSENGALLKEGIHTVIIGKPNVGKSSLMNALTGRDRAIVTEVAGTTRDILEDQINLNGITLNMTDTAGIHDTSDTVEKIGVEKAKSSLDQADLVIYVADSSSPLDQNDKRIFDLLKEKKVIVLLNKSDLQPVISEQDILSLAEKSNDPVLSISAKEGTGIKELEHVIRKMFFQGEISYNNEIVITNIRQKAALKEALDSLEMVKQSIQDQMPEDFYSIDLVNACDALGKITGESVGEDLVNEIFSKFCMGK